MLIKEIKYEDFNGNEVEEKFYFNLSSAELTEWQLSVDGGLEQKINKIINSRNVPEIAALFKEIIMMSYGEKSDDGKRFIKSKELTDSFIQTEAYSNLYMELVQDDKAAADFINGIIPKKLRDQAENVKKSNPKIEIVENK